MAAGSPIPTGDITLLQPQYDQLVEEAGCSDATDTLECLRQVPAATLVDAGKTLPNLFDYAVSWGHLGQCGAVLVLMVRATC